MPATPGVIQSQGTAFKKGTTAVGYLTSIAGVELSADSIETSDLSTAYKTFVQGMKDAGDISLSGNFEPGQHVPFYTDLDTGTSASYSIEFPLQAGATTPTKWTFTAFVTSIKTGTEMGGLVSFETTLKISGKPTLTAGA